MENGYSIVLNTEEMGLLALSLYTQNATAPGVACKNCTFFEKKNMACRHDDNLKIVHFMNGSGCTATCKKRDQWKTWNAKNDCERFKEGPYEMRYLKAKRNNKRRMY